VAVYTLTSEAVADKYIELANKGVDVHVIIDKRQYSALRSTRKLVARMRQAGIEVIPCSSPVKGAIMHLKMTIADGQYVEEGSWNYTPNADLQCNHLNFNREASLDRGQLYRAVWDYIYESQKKPHKN
jgi:phosphatidylserine/phosphatidylglycerophosphate/cardiolipin synthase-like enzyme